MTSRSNACAKETNAVKYSHSIENKVIAADRVAKHGPIIDQDMERMHITRVLTMALFDCKTLDDVDRVVNDAILSSEKVLVETGKNPGFEWKIRNAELQVRELIETGKMKQVDPRYSVIQVRNRTTKAIADSWGHLANYLMQGYELILK